MTNKVVSAEEEEEDAVVMVNHFNLLVCVTIKYKFRLCACLLPENVQVNFKSSQKPTSLIVFHYPRFIRMKC